MDEIGNSCPECGTPLAGARNLLYAPWCSRGCKRLAKNRGPIDPDIIARRRAYVENTELRCVRDELRGRTLAYNTMEASAKALRTRLAYAEEEIAVLRHYASKDTLLLTDTELKARNFYGARMRGAIGADFVLDLHKRTST